MSKQPQKVQNVQSEFSDVLKQIQESRQKVFAQINTALIDLYWQIGQLISQKVSSAAWGKSVVSELVEYALSRNLSPTMVAQYEIQLPDKKLIQAKLHELSDALEDKKQ